MTMWPLLHPLSASVWLLVLLDAAAKAAVLLMAAGLLTAVPRRASAALRHLIWCTAIGGSVAMPVLSVGVPGWQWRILPPALATVRAAPGSGRLRPLSAPGVTRPPPGWPASRPARAAPAVSSPLPALARGATRPGRRITEPVGGSHPPLPWTAWALLVWAAGAALAAAPLAIGTMGVRRIPRREQPMTEGGWTELLARLAEELSLKRGVSLRQSDRISVPMTWGLLRPVVLLPPGAEEWPEERRRVVLLHELAHVQRADCLTQLLAQIACILYWFNPLSWLAARQLRVERERACDDRVLAAGAKASEYAQHLLELARMARRASCSALAGVAMARPSQMEGRLLAVLDSTLPRGALPHLAALVALATGFGAVLALGALKLSAREPLTASPGLSVQKLPPMPEFNYESEQVSPDGTKLVLAHMASGNARGDVQNIAVYDFGSKHLDFVTRFEPPAPAWPDNPVWSPDGSVVVFTQLEHKNTELRIARLGEPARGLYRASPSAGVLRATDWLRDGSALVAVLEGRDKKYTLGLVPMARPEFEPLRSLGSNDGGRPRASPDGQFIVYEAGATGARNLEILATRGKAHYVLAEHPADDAQPLWSPDGRHIVFLSRRHGGWALWGVAVGNGEQAGEPFLIKGGMDSAALLNWLPGGQLVYSEFFPIFDVFTVAVDPATGAAAGKPQQVPYPRTGGNSIPAWSPDGKRLAFFSRTPGDRFMVVVLPAGGGEAREFPIPGDRPAGFPWPEFYNRLTWLPDGSGLSFPAHGKGRSTWLRLNLGTGEWTRPPLPQGAPEWWASAEWTRDGSAYVTTVSPGKDRPDRILEHHLASDQNRVVWTPAPPIAQIRHLRFSPDYKKIAFLAATPKSGNYGRGLMVLDLGSREARLVTPLTGADGRPYLREGPPSWSPDGKHLVVEVNGKKDNALDVVSLNGGAPKELDPPGGRRIQWHPSWSPDGRHIAFSTGRYSVANWVMENVIPTAQTADTVSP
jgi:Tol biopolymer transport system component/beta-lactamase regulating signal transducer with metallopeptidase domain